MTSNPNRFVTWFNMAHPDAYRPLTVEDLEDLKACELIYHYGSYSTRLDGATIMGILKYEQLREKRSIQQPKEDNQEPVKCKRCGQPLPIEPEGKSGRPKEYCSGCELFRSKERQKKLRLKRRNHQRMFMAGKDKREKGEEDKTTELI